MRSKNRRSSTRERVIIDHVEEHTAGMVLDAGFWAGMTLYPESKCSLPRAVDILETYGNERIWMNSACDWGVSDPLAVPKCMLEMKRRRHPAALIDKVVFDNPGPSCPSRTSFLSSRPMRLLLVVLLVLSAGCNRAEIEAEASRNAALQRDIEALREEKAQKDAREAALMEQLEDEAAQKVELLEELERVKPMVERVEEAERRVEEVEEMIKEVKKLE